MMTALFALAFALPALQHHKPKSGGTETKHNARKSDRQMDRSIRRERFDWLDQSEEGDPKH